MNCTKCRSQIDEKANFCQQCGAPINAIKSTFTDYNIFNPYMLLSILVLFYSFMVIIYFIITRVFEAWYNYVYFNLFLNLVILSVPLILSFFIKVNLLKIICIIFSVVAFGLHLFVLINYFLKAQEML